MFIFFKCELCIYSTNKNSEAGDTDIEEMCKGCKALVSSLVLEKRGTFETKWEAAIRAYKVYGVTTTAKLYEDDTEEIN